MYTVVKKTKVTKTIELISSVDECTDEHGSTSSPHFLEFGYPLGSSANSVSSTRSVIVRNPLLGNAIVGIHRSNSSPTKPIRRRGSSCGGSIGGARIYHRQHYFDDDYFVTYTSSSSSSGGVARHQTVTKRNEDNSSNDDLKNG